MSKAIVLLTVVAELWLATGDLAFGAAGSVSGTVSVAGAYQRPKPLPVFKNRSFCGSAVPNETLLIGTDGGLRNAVVLLRLLDGKAPTQPSAVILDNKHCAFTPHVQVATVGSELLLKNSDPILHTVHARMGQETLFNVGLPTWRRVTKRLDRAGVVRIDCDVLHTWMSAAIVVADTPYFAVTDVNGSFVVDKLPIGSYQVDIWHEKLGTKTLKLSVTGDYYVISLDVVYALDQKGK
jgi:plastocyanin